jgi:hypothetical protein
MRQWLESVAGPNYAMALLWTLAALIGLALLLLVVRVIRGLTFGTFVSGGRNRKPRLAVMDATAVDSHRRLVLVRRDDVEHLLLIGGPTDVVVEQDIRFHVQQRRAGLPAGELPEQPVRAPERARPAEIHHPAPSPRAEPSRPLEPPAPRLAPQPAHRPFERPAPQLVRQPPAPPPPAPLPPEPAAIAVPQPVPPEPRPVPEPRPAPRMPAAPAPNGPLVPPLGSRATPAAPRPAPREDKPAPREDIDSTLIDELEVNLENGAAPPAKRRPELSLEDEMTRLLGELSSHKRG